MSTAYPQIVSTLARTSWCLPWLTTLAISAAIVLAMTAFLVGAQPYMLPTASAPATVTNETFVISPACDTPGNWCTPGQPAASPPTTAQQRVEHS